MRGLRGSTRDLIGFTGLGLGGLMELAALIFILVWLYQAWRIVLRGDEEYSAGLMVGLLFVPVFNFYWMFRAILGLSRAAHRTNCATWPRIARTASAISPGCWPASSC